MRKLVAGLVLALIVPAVALAAPSVDVHGVYVEARSAQVYIGGCVMNAEAVTVGREAVLAWRIEEGVVDGVSVDGLSVVAAIAGDENLAVRPDAPRRTVLYVDERADIAQRDALVELFTDRHGELFGTVVEVAPAPISFADTAEGYAVQAAGAVELEARAMKVDHGALDGCGETQWFQPFVDVDDARLGRALSHAFRGEGLNVRWSDPDKNSAFLGRFSF